ncbi:MAG: DUF1289 domain-containing protein [DPANN group archaeon]|nr:DUF1289 domain-containing protein [DPANN group archaeon]
MARKACFIVLACHPAGFPAHCSFGHRSVCSGCFRELSGLLAWKDGD